MKRLSILILVFMLAILISCKKEKPVKCPPEYIAPTDFTAYWRFPSGSKWIYKLDTSIDIYDTVVGTSSLTFDHDSPDGGPCNYNIYQQSFQHSNLKYFQPSYPGSDYSGEYFSSKPDNILRHYSNSNSLFSYHELISYPYIIGDSIRNSSGVIIKLSGIDTFTSSVGKFDSTIHLTTATPVLYPGFKHFAEMFLAKHVGIVKIKYNNGEIWNLVSYEIKK